MVGSGGAGKSTLSVALGAALVLPVVHLDREYWRAGWTPTPDADWRRRVERLVREPRWVMDGNFNATLDLRLEAADAVVFLDLSRWICLWRIARRLLAHHGRTRPDMADGCRESLDWEFAQWVAEFPEQTRPALLERLRRRPERTRLIHLRAPADVRAFTDGTVRHA